MNNINNTSRIIVPIMTHRSNGSDVVKGSKCYEEKCKTQEELALEKKRAASSLLNQRVALSKSKLDRKDDRKDIKKDADLERVDLRSSKLDRKDDRKDIKKDADLERVDLRKGGKFFIPLGLSRPEILKEKWNAFNAWKKEALS